MERIKINHIHKDRLKRTSVIISQIKKASFALIDIEGDFLEELFDEGNSKSYQEIYDHFLVKYEECAEYWDCKTVNILEVKKNYFALHYFPLEKP